MRKIETAVKLLFSNGFWWNLLEISYFNKIFTVQLGIFKFAGVEKSLCGTYLNANRCVDKMNPWRFYNEYVSKGTIYIP